MSSDLIPSCSWTDFKKIVDAGRVSELKSCEVDFNQSTIFTSIIYRGDSDTDGSAKSYSERIAVRTNIQGGKDPQELLEEICPYLNLPVKTDVVVLKRQGSTTKSKKLGVRRAKAKSQGSTRRSGVSVGV